ncbi:DUF421 domain-containing protein [Bacillus sp. FJAT-45350]|uniref:DUF421 domain-containing protein n=1 Tax=Bacillus sp. FJAT-45350 TaxID=2011014 RepID=UPI000BB7890A|nr:DUF421 domain-containing protein [Bacillus sp. FJAT-45350]
MFEFWTGAEDFPLYGFFIRAVIVYLYIFITVKVIGQRSMGTIDPLDFIFGVIIGDILGEPLHTGDLPLTGALISATVISTLHWGLCILALYTPRFRRVIEDEPIVLIEKGEILEKELKKAKITTESLMMDMRLKDASDLNEVDYAVLEMNGQISVIKKSKNQSLTPSDMKIPTPPKGYPTVLIQDGHIIEANLNKVGTLEWLQEQVMKLGCRNATEVFLLTMDEGGQMYISRK